MNIPDKTDDLLHAAVRRALEHLGTDTEPTPAKIPVAPAHLPLQHLAITHHLLQATIESHVFPVIRMQQQIAVVSPHFCFFFAAVAQHAGQRTVTEDKVAGAHPFGVTNIDKVWQGTHHPRPELAALAQHQLGRAPLAEVGDAEGNGVQAIHISWQPHDHPDIGSTAIGGAQRGFHVEAFIAVDQRQHQLIARSTGPQSTLATQQRLQRINARQVQQVQSDLVGFHHPDLVQQLPMALRVGFQPGVQLFDIEYALAQQHLFERDQVDHAQGHIHILKDILITPLGIEHAAQRLILALLQLTGGTRLPPQQPQGTHQHQQANRQQPDLAQQHGRHQVGVIIRLDQTAHLPQGAADRRAEGHLRALLSGHGRVTQIGRAFLLLAHQHPGSSGVFEQPDVPLTGTRGHQ